MTERFWIHTSVTEDQPDIGMPFGEATVGIVDEHEGGVVLYCHEASAPSILKMFRRSAAPAGKLVFQGAIVDTHQELPESERFVTVWGETEWFERVKLARFE